MKNELVIKEVNFNGDNLMAVQDDSNGKVYVGVSWVCNGIGFEKGQKDRQVKNVQSDIVIKQGCVKFDAGVFDEYNDTLAIELDYLPIWLAKISITPKMQKENPIVTEKLVNYQLKAKDVLAQAFVKTQPINLDKFQIPETLSDALLLSANLAKENEVMKPKANQFDLYLDSDGTFAWNQSAKKLKTKRNKLMDFLRCKKVLNQDNTPSSYYADRDYFEVKSFTYVFKHDKKFQMATTRVTTKGQDFLYRYLMKYIDEYSKFDVDFKNRIKEVA